MKRGAEKQLTKDGPDALEDEDIQEIQELQGFQKADEGSLAKRQIRALPKRALAGSRPPSLNGFSSAPAPDADKAEPAPQPKFVGFSGFGTGTAASNPFTFTPQPFASGSMSSAMNSAEKSTTEVKATASSSFPGAANLFPSSSVSSAAPPTTSVPSEETDTVAFKYFKSLRGLNVSFLSAISTAVEKDPFFDVAGLVESYKNLRTTIQAEFDAPPKPTTAHAAATTNSESLFGAKAPSEKNAGISIPVRNVTKTGFTLPPFVPPPGPILPFDPKRSEWSIPSATPPEPPKSAFAFPATSTPASMSSVTPTSIFSFAAPPSIDNMPSKPPPGPSDQTAAESSTGPLPRPAPPVPVTNVPNFLSAKPTAVFGTSDATSKPVSVFVGSMFGNNNTAEPPKLPPLNPPPDSKDSSRSTTPLFGNVTSSSTSASAFGSSSDKSVSFFGSAAPPKPGGFTFGKPGGSIGNPVGFGFGSPSPSTGDMSIPGPSSSGFSFGVPSTKPSERLFSPPITDKSSESTPQPEGEGNDEVGEEDAMKLLPSHTHDEEGKGEEEEETTYSVKCKLFRLSKIEDKNEWKDLGVGIVRLKRHKETDARRILMRNSNTGRILLNLRIHGSLKLSLAKNMITFIGNEGSTSTSFRIRVKTEEQAGELKGAFEQEIAAVQET